MKKQEKAGIMEQDARNAKDILHHCASGLPPNGLAASEFVDRLIREGRRADGPARAALVALMQRTSCREHICLKDGLWYLTADLIKPS